jgi:hypothetical protein
VICTLTVVAVVGGGHGHSDACMPSPFAAGLKQK